MYRTVNVWVCIVMLYCCVYNMCVYLSVWCFSLEARYFYYNHKHTDNKKETIKDHCSFICFSSVFALVAPRSWHEQMDFIHLGVAFGRVLRQSCLICLNHDLFFDLVPKFHSHRGEWMGIGTFLDRFWFQYFFIFHRKLSLSLRTFTGEVKVPGWHWR